MDVTAAMMGTGFAKDAATFNLAASMEEAGVFPSASTHPFEADIIGQYDPSPANDTRHAKIVIALVAGVFAVTAALAWYLMVS